ncbi:MAG: glycosyltransferase family 2 protein [Pirellulales bacterium]|nr:glycosyltransferase family 2 protein [Pirellulales bacterium]
MPTFSIVVPTYNHATYLPRALDSVLAQQSTDWELIVVDDGSTDDTPQVLEPYRCRAQIIHTANRGAPAARNTGIAAAAGQYIVLLDADDRLLPGAIGAFAWGLALRPGADLVGAAYASIAENGRRKPRRPPAITGHREADFCNCISGAIEFQNGAVAVRRAVYSRVKYPESIRTLDDVVFFAWLVATDDYVVVDEIVVEKFAHPGRLRDDYRGVVNDGLRASALLFDPRRLPVEFMAYEPTFRARQLLTLFRAHYRRREFRVANACFLSAWRADWRQAVRWPYLRKALRSLPFGWDKRCAVESDQREAARAYPPEAAARDHSGEPHAGEPTAVPGQR